MRIHITGIGMVSPVGLNVAENFRSLQDGTSGIRWSERHQMMMGEVALTNEQIESEFNLPTGLCSRTTLLGMKAAKEAWGERTSQSSVRTGFISGTSVGGLDILEDHYFKYLDDPSYPYQPHMIYENGLCSERIAASLDIRGHIGTIATACSSGANSIMQAARLIQAGKLDRVVAGSSDPIAIVNAKGFSSLMIYDSEPCRPFDESRKGLNLGEGAAFLVLESAASMEKTGNKSIAQLVGWNNSSDAHHQTASSEDGTGSTLSMNLALQKAGLKSDDIDYLNAHGTGTPNNDLSESVAIKNVFGNHIPPFSSTKAFTGHTLAAAGAIESVFCILALQHQCFLPNLNFNNAMNETGLQPVTSFTGQQNVQHVMTNSFGFGGNCTSLIFKK